jgi:hypothetical protein
MTALRYYQSEDGSSTAGTGAGVTTPYPAFYIANAALPTDFTNRAQGGDAGRLEAYISRQATEIAAFYITPAINLMSISFSNGLEPANLASTDGGDVNAYAARAAAYLDTFMAQPRCFVVVLTSAPKSDSGFNANRNALNAITRTWVGIHCHAIADIAADPDIGSDAAGSDPSKYSDGTHLTQSTHDKYETILGPVLMGFGGRMIWSSRR